MSIRWFIAAIALTSGSAFGQAIATIAGGATSGCSKADGVPAVNACMLPSGIAFDSQGNLYYSDGQYYKVRKIDKNGIVTTVAGSTFGFSGDGGPATSAQLILQGGSPGLSGLAVDAQNNIFISDTHNCVIRLVTAATGIITTIAGNTTNFANPSCGSQGDGGPATKASLYFPAGIALDGAGNLYIADNLSNKVRKVDMSTGIITAVAGNGSPKFSGDGGQATAAGLDSPLGVKFDSRGNMYIAEGNRIRKVDTTGIITTIAGQPGDGTNSGSTGDGGPAIDAKLFGPLDIVIDGPGNIFIADNQNLRVRKIDTSGIITNYAGKFGPVSTPVGDGGPATNAYLGNPLGLLLDSAGELFISETQQAIRKVSAPGAFVCTNTAPVTITSIDSASAYGSYSYFASGSWLEIKGSNLADPNDPRLASGSGQWGSADFNGPSAPTNLDGITVSINGKPAYVWYLSPTQLNVQAPEDSATGNVSITVTNCKATSSPAMFSRRALAPGLLAPSNYSAKGTQYLVATFQADGAYVLNTSLGASFGLNARPAKPGDVIIAYGIGFGDVTPLILPGTIVSQSNQLANPVTFTFGSTPATLSYSGLAGSFVGLYEFYITVPSGLAPADYQIHVTQNGTALPQTLYLTVGN